ncbi:hypothetical protein ACTFIY_012020 [Dictyostelium cf. discoideum]
MNDKPQKIELDNLTELSKVKESNYIVNIFNHPKRSNSKTNKPIVSLIHSTGKSNTALIPTLKCLIVPNRDNMDKPKIIINSHTKEEQFKLILDTGSNVSLINKRLISKEMENHVHKTKAKINFPLLDVKEEFVEQINIQVNNEIHTFFIIELDIIDSNQLHCNVKAPRKHVTLSNDNQSDPHSILDDDDDIKEQVAKFVESIPSQLCDILAKTNPEEEENMGYFQVLINPEHAKYTAFITHIGKFEYTRMPQGLVNSPSTSARLMVEIFGKIKSLLQYFDDLLFVLSEKTQLYGSFH